jgi:hypothetical protein
MVFGGEPAVSRNFREELSSMRGVSCLAFFATPALATRPSEMSREASDLDYETFSLDITPTCFFCLSPLPSSLSSVIREIFFNLVSVRILLPKPYRHRSRLPCHLLATFGFGTSTAFAFKLDGITVSLSDTRSFFFLPLFSFGFSSCFGCFGFAVWTPLVLVCCSTGRNSFLLFFAVPMQMPVPVLVVSGGKRAKETLQ